mgnify:CR=1 FL=1
MLQVVIVYMGLYQHWALLSDRTRDGKPMLISNTRRNGTVKEESWDQVVGNRQFKVHYIQINTSPSLILARARNCINRVKYDLLQYNCEHFVREVITGVAKSTQVKQALAVGSLTVGALYLMSRNR